MADSLFRIDGLISNLDTTGIIDALITRSSQPIVQMQEEQQMIQWKNEAYTLANVKLLALLGSASILANEDLFNSHSVTSSNTSVATATADTTALNTTYNLTVNNLAEATVVTSNQWIKSSANVEKADSSPLSTNRSWEDAGFSTTPTGSVTINGQVFNLADYATVDDFMYAVSNDATANVELYYDRTQKKFVMFSNDSNEFNISENVGSSGKGFFEVAGFYRKTESTNTVDIDPSLDWDNAGFTNSIDGTITINGATFDPRSYATVNDFINAVNTNAQADVTLTYNNVNKKFILESDSSGKKFRLSETGTNPFFKEVGIDVNYALAVNPTTVLKNANTLEQVQDNSTFRINGVEFTVDTDVDALNDIIDDINKSNAGVTAFYDAYTNTLTIQANDTGDKSISMADVSGNFLQSFLIKDTFDDVESEKYVSTATYSDDFNVDDSLAGWTQVRGTYTESSGYLQFQFRYSVNNNLIVKDEITDDTNHESNFTLIQNGSQPVEYAFHWQGGSDAFNMYTVRFDPTNDRIQFFKKVGSTYTQIGSDIAFDFYNGVSQHNIKVKVFDQDVKVYVDDMNNPVGETTFDGTFTEGKAGFSYLDNVGGAQYIDDVSIHPLNLDTSQSWANAGFSTVPDGSVTINGATFNLADYTTVDDFINAVNADTTANVTISYDKNQNKFSIARDAGYEGSPLLLSETGTNGFFTVTNIPFNSDVGVEIRGKNASFTLNGTDMTRSENTFEINGTTFTLKGTGDTVIEVSQDIDSIVSAVNDFVAKYNDTIDYLNEKLTEKKAEDPQTDEEKKQGILNSDSTLLEIENTLKSIVTQSVSDLDSSMNDLADIGISTGEAGLSIDVISLGHLYVDEDKLREALRDNPLQVADIFAKDTVSVSGEVPSGTMDGVNKTFTIANTPVSFEKDPVVVLDGTTLSQVYGSTTVPSTSEFKLDYQTGELVLGDAPDASSTLTIDYEYEVESGEKSGILTRLKKALDDITNESEGLIDSITDSLKERYDSLSESIKDYQYRIELERQMLLEKYTSLEEQLAKFQSQSAYLDSQIAALKNLMSGGGLSKKK